MPAWIIAIRVDEGYQLIEGGTYEVTTADLARHSALEEVMARADEMDIGRHWLPPVQESYLEGRSMVERYDMHGTLEHEAVLVYDSKHYHVQIVFDYERPVQM